MQLAAVQYILDTVIQALDANPDRKFVYGEMVSCVRANPVVYAKRTPFACIIVGCLKILLLTGHLTCKSEHSVVEHLILCLWHNPIVAVHVAVQS